MRLIDVSFERPAMNLALDEVLLDSLESGRAGETLRFWESPSPFVVLGVSQVLAEHVDEAACAAERVTVMRRCTAGGCVLQGPGSLNYTLILAHEGRAELATIRSSYVYILGCIAEALGARGIDARHMGICDLAVGDMKFSGNAQRRRKRGILHHGTLLYGLDLELVERCLSEPADRPEYRRDRKHARFVRNVDLTTETLKTAVREAFNVEDEAAAPLAEELAAAERLAHEKYDIPEWTRRR
ncbi:MAG: lipoate--protein ligase family protein [FCB group bacterium]|nr:lipoate--protein ligase family protein [FCB group bacterium]